MKHPIYRVTSFDIVGPYTLRVAFDDGSEQTIDFSPILFGEIFGPLRDLNLFAQVRIDPATLHDWPEHVKALGLLAQRWKLGAA